MNRTDQQECFYLEITSLEAFAAFVALIRGSDLDDPKLLEMTNRLRKSTNAEEAAVKAATKEK